MALAAEPAIDDLSMHDERSAGFLAIGMVLNGIVHPLLSVRAGGYFPGLVTSPLVGARLWTSRRLGH